MKKLILILILSLTLIFAGCSEKDEIKPVIIPEQKLSCGEYAHGDSWINDCNTCSCENGEIQCTTEECQDEESLAELFNSNLEAHEQEWLEYLENKYDTRIFFLKSKSLGGEGNYEIQYKKDRNIIKLKILKGELSQESKITDDLFVEIENAQVCSLFQGKWNECPSICETDEVACATVCGDPVCEFEEDKIILKKSGEQCGGLDAGDCEFGLTCKYANKDDKYGTCS